MSLNPKTRKRWKVILWERQKGRCYWCDKRMFRHVHCDHFATFEHLIPRSQGGGDIFENFVLAHRSCNQRRGDMPGHVFMAGLVSSSSKGGLS